MFLWILSLLLLINVAMADPGKVSQISGASDAYLTRAGSKIRLSANMNLEKGDVLSTENSAVVINLQSATQISLAKKTQVSLQNNSQSIVQFIKGIIRVQVRGKVEQTIQADGVSFAGKGTEFEVSQAAQEIDLDVIEGEVLVSSPFVQTFVPEIVKGNEGFSFNKKKREFRRRKLLKGKK